MSMALRMGVQDERPALVKLAIPVGLAPLLLAASLGSGVARAGEIKGASGLQSLGSVINGIRNGSCTAGHCSITGGTGAGSNLFHRFEKFDTRGSISGASINNDSFSNVIVGVIDPAGSFINKMVALSSKGNLFWLSPGGISLTAGGGFTNVATLQLSTATTLAVGSGFFDVYGSTASQVAGLRGIPIPGSPGLSTDPASLSAIGLSANGDLTIDDGLLTVDHSLLLDSQGGHLLLNASSLSADGGTIALAGRSVSLESSSLDVSNDIGSGGSVSIDAADIVIASSSINASGATAGGSISIAATGSVNLSDSDLTAIGGDGSLPLPGGAGGDDTTQTADADTTAESTDASATATAAEDNGRSTESSQTTPSTAETETAPGADEPDASTTVSTGEPEPKPEPEPEPQDTPQLDTQPSTAEASAATDPDPDPSGSLPGSSTETDGSARNDAAPAAPDTADAPAPGGTIRISGADIAITGGSLDASGSTDSGQIATDSSSASTWSPSLQSTGLATQMDQAIGEATDPASPDPLLQQEDNTSTQTSLSPEPTAPATESSTTLVSQAGGSAEATTPDIPAAAEPADEPEPATTADAAEPAGGAITLQAADTLTLTGATLTANGSGSQARGGSILLEADAIALAASSIDASGTAAGGTVRIGGGRRGEDTSIRNASTLTAGADTTISVEATTAGDGGELILYASDVASIDAQLSATGGADSGDGGFIETSAGFLSVTQAPDISATNGNAGTWLIDPYNIDIVTTPDSRITTGTPFQGTGDGTQNSQLSATTLNTALNAGGTVQIDTQGAPSTPAGNIRILAPISTTAGTGGATLVFLANGSIELDADIQSTANALDVEFIVDADNSSGGETFQWSSGTLDLRGGTAKALTGDSATDGPTVINGAAVVASNTTFQTGTTSLATTSLTVDGAYNDLNGFSMSGGTLTGSGDITLSGNNTWSGGTISGNGQLTVSGPLEISGSTVPTVLDGRTLKHTNAEGSSSLVSGATVSLGNGATFLNDTGAHLKIEVVGENGVTAIRERVDEEGIFRNKGKVVKSGLGLFRTGLRRSTKFTFENESSGEIFILEGRIRVRHLFDQEGAIEISEGATLRVPVGFTNDGTISGQGRIGLDDQDRGVISTLINEGTISPGGIDNAGSITITGNLEQGSEGKLELEIGGTGSNQSDQIVVSGTTSLGGSLNASLINSYAPANGDQIEIALIESTGAISGSFSSEPLPPGFTSQTDTTSTPQSFDLVFFSCANGTICWDGGGTDNLWSTAENWNTDLLPTSIDQVALELIGGDAILFDGSGAANNVSIASLFSTADNSLTISGGSLSLDSTTLASTLNGGLTLSGGSLGGAGDLTLAGSTTWSGGTIAGTGGLTVSGPLAITDSTVLDGRTLTSSSGASFSQNGSLELTNAATLAVADGFTNDGTISGNGTIDLSGSGTLTTLTNAGTLAPGGTDSAGTLTIDGNLQQAAGGTLALELGGTGSNQSDQIVVSGTTSLGGSLNASLINSYAPANGDQIEIALIESTGAISGSFSSEPLPPGFTSQTDTTSTPQSFDLVFFSCANGTICWDGGGTDNLWSTAENWNTDLLPTSIDQVALELIGGDAILFDGSGAANNVSIASLFSTADNSLTISGGSLSLDSTTLASTLNGGLTLSGGSLGGAGDLTLAGSTTWSGGTIAGTGGLTVSGPLAITDSTVLDGRTLTSSSGASFSQNGSLELTNAATLAVADGFTNDGTISGNGTIDLSGSGTLTTLTNAGTLAPGGTDSAGTLTIDGNLQQAAGGTLALELGGTGSNQSDQIVVSGTTSLGGSLNASLINSYAPANGDQIEIALIESTGAISGSFSSEPLPPGFTSQTDTTSTPQSFDLVFFSCANGTICWDGGGTDNLWSTAENWNTDLLPTSIDQVALELIGGDAILFDGSGAANNVSIASLFSTADNSLTISGGSLSLDSTTLASTLNGGLTLSGGSLGGAGDLTLAGSTTWSGGTIAGTGGLTVSGPLAITDSTVLDGRTLTSSSGASFSQNGSLELTNAATLAVADGFTNDGTISGNGTIDLSGSGTLTTLTNAGTLAPGGTDSAGTLTIDGNLQQAAGGTLALELGGTGSGQADRLTVRGQVDLAGAIETNLINGFNPADGDRIVVLDSTGVRGDFDSQDDVPAGLVIQQSPLAAPTSLALVDPVPEDPTPPPVPIPDIPEPSLPPVPEASEQPGPEPPAPPNGGGSPQAPPVVDAPQPESTTQPLTGSPGPVDPAEPSEPRLPGPVGELLGDPQAQGTLQAVSETQTEQQTLGTPGEDPAAPSAAPVPIGSGPSEAGSESPVALGLGASDFSGGAADSESSTGNQGPAGSAPADTGTSPQDGADGSADASGSPQASEGPSESSGDRGDDSAQDDNSGDDQEAGAAGPQDPDNPFAGPAAVQALSPSQATASMSESEQRSRDLMEKLLNLRSSSSGSNLDGPRTVPGPAQLQQTLLNAMEVVRRRLQGGL
ncbi:hypothetical protein EVJ50_13990 [Synechococcus sp. RSCCF101]|uniref:hypothetical protein n=1 Tax=Synechococcus sp. RSCCF101 TaxID=2511069 RepID=UPI0012493ACA|nr:hypothetical protein [Synechococcus sp. RSCCF101]QEY33181.1 hypothetical protein EVJ50_13990 [Synechococcus sp. RSCCF101]